MSELVPADVTLKIITQLFVTNAKAKRKIYRDGLSTDAPVDPITIAYDETDPDDYLTSPASQVAVSLGLTDVYRINYIKMGEG